MNFPEPDKVQIQCELDRITHSATFEPLARLCELLTYLVTERLEGRAKNLKAFSIAMDVFGRNDDFDQTNDSIVRVQAARLRTALDQYYATEGAESQVRISLPKGSYVPVFERLDPPNQALDPGTQPETDIVARDIDPADFVDVPSSFTSDGAAASHLQNSPGLTRPRSAPEFTWRIASLGAGLAVLALVAVAYWARSPNQLSKNVLRPALNTMAILPFRATANTRDAALTISNRITLVLGQSGDLKVKFGPAWSTQRLNSQELMTLAEQLDVRWIIMGEIDQDQRLTTVLADGLNGQIEWSNTLKATGTQLLDYENAARQVIFDLRPQLFAGARRAAERMPDSELSALDLYFLASWPWGAAQNALQWELQRVAFARRAVAKDRYQGGAHSILADKLSFLANLDPAWDTPDLNAEARKSALDAIGLAPTSSEVVFNVALHYWHSGELEEAERLFSRVLELNPGHAVAELTSISLPYECRPVPASVIAQIKEFDERLAPANPVRWMPLHLLARFYFQNGDYQASVSAAKRSGQVFGNPNNELYLAAALVQLGELGAARNSFAATKLRWPTLSLQHNIQRSVPRLCAGRPLLQANQKLLTALAEVVMAEAPRDGASK